MTTATFNPFKAPAVIDRAVEVEDKRIRDNSCTVRIMDKYCQLAEFANDYIELEFDIQKNKAGAISITLPGDTACRDHIFRNPDGADAVVPIIVDTAGFQWTGQVDVASVVVDENGTETIELTGVHDWDWAASVAMWPSPFAPLIAQFPKRMFGIGPVRTLIHTFYKANLLRLQLPLWRIPSLDQLFNPSAWFNVANANFPVAVAPIDVLHDTSEWCAVSARMQMGSDLFEQALKDSGVSLTVKLIIPGEHEQPFKQFFGNWDRPTLLLGTEDHSGIIGPTGTVVDGAIKWLGALGQGALDTILGSGPDRTSIVSDGDIVMNDELGKLQRLVGLRQDPPRAIWLDGQYTGIIDGRLDMHKPVCRDMIVGGRSPGWVNSGIEVGIQQLLNFVGTYLGVGGLSALYQGQLSDVFMAWMRFSSPQRTKAAGPYLKHERVVANGSQAYTVSGYMDGVEALFDSRGYTSKTIRIRDGAPLLFGRDVNIGEIVGYELDSILWCDYLSGATFRDSRDQRAQWELTIGDGSAEESSGAKAFRKLGDLMKNVQDLATDVGADLGLEIFG